MTSARSPFWRLKYHAPPAVPSAMTISPASQYGRREVRPGDRPGTLRAACPLLPIGGPDGLRGGEPLGGLSVCG